MIVARLLEANLGHFNLISEAKRSVVRLGIIIDVGVRAKALPNGHPKVVHGRGSDPSRHGTSQKLHETGPARIHLLIITGVLTSALIL
jgi:hypothetical protein